MRMGDFFAHDFAQDHFLIESFFLCQSDFANNFEILTDIWGYFFVGCYIPHPTVVFFGNYQ